MTPLKTSKLHPQQLFNPTTNYFVKYKIDNYFGGKRLTFTIHQERRCKNSKIVEREYYFKLHLIFVSLYLYLLVS